MKHKLFSASAEAVGERQVRLILSSDALDRTGEIVEQSGAELANYKLNPIWLWQHDPRMPVGNAVEIAVSDKGLLEVLVEFAPAGISPKADEICGLVKAGVIRGASLGFDPIDEVPMDPRNPKGPKRVKRWELLEGSFVSIPANAEAIVTQRAAPGDQKETSAMTEQTGKTGPEVLPVTVEWTHATPRTKALGARRVKGLYDIGQICYLLDSLGYAAERARIEAALEGDASAVPGLLVDALQALGGALVAMAAEEVAELLAEHAGGEGDDVEVIKNDDGSDLSPDDAAIVTAAATPAQRKFRLGFLRAKHVAASVKEGRKISAETAKCIKAACDQHDEAMDLHRKALGLHKKAVGALRDLMDGDNTDTEVQTSEGTDAIGDHGTSKATRAQIVKALDRSAAA